MQLGQSSAAQQAQSERRPSTLVHARAPDLNLTGGDQASARERGDGGERLTGGARLSSLTLRQRAGEPTGDVSGHGEVS